MHVIYFNFTIKNLNQGTNFVVVYTATPMIITWTKLSKNLFIFEDSLTILYNYVDQMSYRMKIV